jgi:hypothetical protein
MRNLKCKPSKSEVSQLPTDPRAHLISFGPTACINNQNTQSGDNAVRPLWWELPQTLPSDVSWAKRPARDLPSLEALRKVKLSLALSRRGRQAVGELTLGVLSPEVEASSPLTLFTGS